MQPRVLLLDPLWNLNVVCWMDLQTFTLKAVKSLLKNERGNHTIQLVARPWRFRMLVSPVSTGELCPPTSLNAAHDGIDSPSGCQVKRVTKIKNYIIEVPR